MRDTKGRRAFAAWKAAHSDLPLAEIGRKLGVSAQAVGGWLDGSSTPEPIYRAALKVLCGIEERSWETVQERDRAHRAMRGATSLADRLRTGS